jgi:hypothetical protein
VKTSFVDRGEVRDHMLQQDILDVNGHYEKGKPFVGALGGQLMQLVLAAQAISNHDLEVKSEEASKQPSIEAASAATGKPPASTTSSA